MQTLRVIERLENRRLVFCVKTQMRQLFGKANDNNVSLSTTESEYVSAASAVKEIIWLKGLLTECENRDNGKICLFIDNMSAIRLIKNPEFHQRSKHIDVKFHFIREMYKRGVIDVKHISSDKQIADIFTKAIAKLRFIDLRSKLGLVSRSLL